MNTRDNRPSRSTELESTALETTEFDQHARALYRRSLEQLPAGLHGRLRSARATALAEGQRDRRPRWLPAGIAVAAVLAVVAMIGLQQVPGPAAPPALAQTRPVAPAPAPLASSDPELALILDSLENNPDFYLWLASNDVAMPPPER